MPFREIRVDVEAEVATITMDRPERRNAFTRVMGAELLEAFGALDREPAVRVVVLTGAGDRAFSAGADMDLFEAQIAAAGKDDAGPDLAERLPLLLRRFSKPLVAAVNGHAVGAGATLSLLCDVRIAAAEARIGFVFARMGVMAEFGSTFLLPRIVGVGRAAEVLFTGGMLGAEAAERLGIFNRVVPRAELGKAVRETADEMRKCAPRSLRLTRQALYQGLDSSFESALRNEAYVLEYLYGTEDHREAVAAFREKRTPRFRGEVSG